MSVPPRGLQRWLLGREASWHRLAAWVECGRERGTRDSAEVIAIARAHAGLATDVGLARSVLGAGADLTLRLEALLATSSALLYRTPSRWRDQIAQLFRFVIAHGVVELSVICIAVTAGISLGEALARPGSRSRARAFQTAVIEAGQVLVVMSGVWRRTPTA